LHSSPSSSTTANERDELAPPNAIEGADDRHRWLLRIQPQRPPRRNATYQSDEFPSPHRSPSPGITAYQIASGVVRHSKTR